MIFITTAGSVIATHENVSSSVRYAILEASGFFFLAQEVVNLLLLCVFAGRVSRTARNLYNFGYHKYKIRFMVIIMNMLFWSAFKLLCDAIDWPYESCIYKVLAGL